MDLYFLVYSSVPAKVLADAEFDQLLRSWQKRNQSTGISGILLCLPGMYLHLLEGEKEAVLELYNKIQKDKLHIKVDTLHQGAIKRRYFPKYSLACDRNQPNPEMEGLISITSPQGLALIDILQS